MFWKPLCDDDPVDMPVPGALDQMRRSDVTNRVAEFLIDISGLFRMGSSIFPDDQQHTLQHLL